MRPFDARTNIKNTAFARVASASAPPNSEWMRADDMTTEERQLALMTIQNKMQRLHNSIEHRLFLKGHHAQTRQRKQINNSLAEFALLEIEERKLLRPGTLLCPAARKAMRL